MLVILLSACGYIAIAAIKALELHGPQPFMIARELVTEDEVSLILIPIVLGGIVEFFYELLSMALIGPIESPERAEAIYSHFVPSLVKYYVDNQAVMIFGNITMPQPFALALAIIVKDITFAYQTIVVRRVNDLYLNTARPNAQYVLHCALNLFTFIVLALFAARAFNTMGSADLMFSYVAIETVGSAVVMMLSVCRLGLWTLLRMKSVRSEALLQVGLLTSTVSLFMQLCVILVQPYLMHKCGFIDLSAPFVLYFVAPRLYSILAGLIRSFSEFRRFRRIMRLFSSFPPPTPEALEDATCTICYDSVIHGAMGDSTPIQLPCGHILHGGCLRSWAARSAACPVCRADFSHVSAESGGQPRAATMQRDIEQEQREEETREGHQEQQDQPPAEPAPEPESARYRVTGITEPIIHGEDAEGRPILISAIPGSHVVWVPLVVPTNGEMDGDGLRAAYLEAARAVCDRQRQLEIQTAGQG
ncbi:Ring finger domain [Carpediemonas membranifera]|uniref:Ring finger domain n=1 Tax=Carpediemonas membranifera TaxID=201153 RepID=A0A8J6AXV1_9EUKA|nr:Ring finger domain [Carpediemonas membranifera]|eukprot:KAG9397516.1 Ring finger domain [Carpediemonas membranifera]